MTVFGGAAGYCHSEEFSNESLGLGRGQSRLPTWMPGAQILGLPRAADKAVWSAIR